MRRIERDLFIRRPEAVFEIGPLIEAGVTWHKLASILPSIYPALFPRAAPAPDPEALKAAWASLSEAERDWRSFFVDAEQEAILLREFEEACGIRP
jgi:hypothetical protein